MYRLLVAVVVVLGTVAVASAQDCTVDGKCVYIAKTYRQIINYHCILYRSGS